MVPTPVLVKKAGMPAPPARSFSASVPWGVNSSSSSPARYWRSNSLFSPTYDRSEEHTSELQSQSNLVCRLLLEKKKKLCLDKSEYERALANKLEIMLNMHGCKQDNSA